MTLAELELESLEQLVGAHRLVTVTGPPGCGKSWLLERWAKQTARELLLVDGSAVAWPELLLARIAEQLGAASAADLPHALAEAGELILCLDGIDQLAQPVAQQVPHWLEQGPGLRLVVTSSVRLGLAMEQLLRLPAADASRNATDRPAPETHPQLSLLVQAVRRVDPSFAPDASMADDLWHLVLALDRHPLALSILAQSLATVGIAAVRAEDPAELVIRRDSASPLRALSRTLEAAWVELDAATRETLLYLSALRGNFPLLLAQQVMAHVTGGHLPARRVTATLELLCNRSLVTSEARQGERSYRVVAVVRAFATRRLQQQGRQQAVRDLCLEGVVAAAEEQTDAGARDVLFSALSEVVQQGLRPDCGPRCVELATRALLAMGPLRHTLVSLPTCLTWETSLAAHAEAAALSCSLRAALLLGLAETQRHQGLAGSIATLTEAQRLAQEAADQPLIQQARDQLLAVSVDQNQLEVAEELTHALAADALPGQGEQPPWSLLDAARLQRRAGELQRADELLSAAERRFEAQGNRAGVAEALTQRGLVAEDSGQPLQARSFYERAAQRIEQGDAPRIRALAQVNLARGLHLCGELEASAEHYARALQGFEAIGDQRSLGASNLGLALVQLEQGLLEQAQMHLSLAAAQLATTHRTRHNVICDAVAGVVAALAGEAAQAAAHHQRAAADLGQLAQSGQGLRFTIWLAGRCQAMAARVQQQSGGCHGLASADCSSETQAALAESIRFSMARHADRALACWAVRLGCATPDAAAQAVIVQRDAARFTTGQGDVADLSAKREMRELLQLLLNAQQHVPGETVASRELCLALWGRKSDPKALQKRLQMTVNRLRKLGLQQALVSGPGGYHLDPELTHVAQ